MLKYGFDKEGDYGTPTKEEIAILKKIGKRYKELMEDKMKDLKRGDFVWSKMYGNGIVYCAQEGWSAGILFENQDDIIWCAREELFAKGDEVELKDNKSGIFLGITHHQGMRYGILIIEDRYNCIIFAEDMKHKVIDKLEVILTMNGKEIDAKAISKETWDNLRGIK